MLLAILRPSDRESISGDLLEEYLSSRRPGRGALLANAWYLRSVLSVLWRLIRPSALAVTALTLLSMAIRGKGLGYGSLVQVPGGSLVDAVIFVSYIQLTLPTILRLTTTGICR